MSAQVNFSPITKLWSEKARHDLAEAIALAVICEGGFDSSKKTVVWNSDVEGYALSQDKNIWVYPPNGRRNDWILSFRYHDAKFANKILAGLQTLIMPT